MVPQSISAVKMSESGPRQPSFKHCKLQPKSYFHGDLFFDRRAFEMNISFSILVIYLLLDLVTPASDIPTSQTVLLIQVGRVQLVQSFSGKPVYNCNGIIVRPWWILTSARCLVNSYFQFRFAQGSSVLIGCSSTGSNCPSYELQTIIPHPCFNPLDGFYHDDLALLQIKQTLQNQHQCLPSALMASMGLRASALVHPSPGLEYSKQPAPTFPKMGLNI